MLCSDRTVIDDDVLLVIILIMSCRCFFFQMHDSSGYFDGCIDNVLIDQEDLNLWKPASVEGNRSFCTRR